MARENVRVMAKTSATPDAIWAVARDFCGAWHPGLSSIVAEAGPAGAMIRRFTVHGEDTVYREQMTYLSDSDRTLSYTHLQGVAGANRYIGRLSVSPSDEGAVINWSADITAPAARAAQIAAGTKPIFETGIAALIKAAETWPRPTPLADVPTATLYSRILSGTPQLALTHTDAKPGPLVLFLHGIGGARENWDLQLQAVGHLAQAAALDLRGYGDSTLGFRQSNVDDYCEDILRVMTAFGAEKLILVGLSYGSWIATSFAMRHPDKLAGLVLSGGCTGMSEAGPEEREAFRVSREVPLDAGQSPAHFAPAVVGVIAGPNASTALRAQLLASMSAIPAATYRDALRCFTNPLERFDFARLTMPVLLMTGEHDRLAPPAEIRAVAERITDAAPLADVRYETIPDAGHVCNAAQPVAYNSPLLTLLRRVLP
jgi:pimeloyl-ACP methyl ester carboxylesterase